MLLQGELVKRKGSKSQQAESPKKGGLVSAAAFLAAQKE